MTDIDTAQLMAEAPAGRERAEADARPRPRSPAEPWKCICYGEERRGEWRHSPSCPVRGPGWTRPPSFAPHPILRTGRPYRQVRNVDKVLWIREEDTEPGVTSKLGRQLTAWRRAEAVRLHAAGLNYTEIGERLGITDTWARQLIVRARKKAPPQGEPASPGEPQERQEGALAGAQG